MIFWEHCSSYIIFELIVCVTQLIFFSCRCVSNIFFSSGEVKSVKFVFDSAGLRMHSTLEGVVCPPSLCWQVSIISNIAVRSSLHTQKVHPSVRSGTVIIGQLQSLPTDIFLLTAKHCKQIIWVLSGAVICQPYITLAM